MAGKSSFDKAYAGIAIVLCLSAVFLLAHRPKLSHEGALTKLGLRGPIVIKEADMYSDGGTVYATFVDADAKLLACCMAWGEAPPGTSGHLFVNAKHPTFAGAVEILPQSETEQAVAIVLRHWFDDRLICNSTEDSKRKRHRGFNAN